MIRVADLFILVLWIGWLAYWLIASRRAKQTRWREPLRERWLHSALALLGTLVLIVPRFTPLFLHARFLGERVIFAPLGAVVTALGLAIAVAARMQLAGNWSAAVEIKEDHALIRDGLYRRVRHPIYSGLLLALFGSAIAIDQWRELIGCALILVALMLKSRHEEKRLRQTFSDYAAYARQTAALIPFLL